MDALRPVPRSELNELVVDLISRRTELNELFVNDFELNLRHSDTTPHPGKSSKHSQQSTPSIYPGNKDRASGLGFALEGT